MQKADALLDIMNDLLESRMPRKCASPVRRGAVGKGLRKQYLAGRLPYKGEWSGAGASAFPCRRRCTTGPEARPNPPGYVGGTW